MSGRSLLSHCCIWFSLTPGPRLSDTVLVFCFRALPVLVDSDEEIMTRSEIAEKMFSSEKIM